MKKQTLPNSDPVAEVNVMRVVNKAKVNYVISLKYNGKTSSIFMRTQK